MARDCENCKHRVMKVEVGKGTPPEHFWGCECWECEFEPTTKNDLGVDLISRADVLKLMQDNWHAHNGDWAMQESMDDIRALPSVTPQEPRWIPVSERLPDTDNEVLCWYEYYHWSQEKVLPEYGFGCYLRETSAWFGEVAVGKDVRVIAWMPLPRGIWE